VQGEGPREGGFESLARDLAAGEISRRSALRRLAGGALAVGLAALPGAEAVASAGGKRCPKSRRCGDRCCPKNASCKKGKCKCEAGYAKCGKKCVDLDTSVKNCGACGNACADGQVCTSGVCHGTECSVASDCPEDGNCGTKSCNNGTCEYTPNPNVGGPCISGGEQGTAVCNGQTGEVTCATFCSDPSNDGKVCDDQNACTTNNVCSGGACSGTPVICSAQDECHDVGSCNPDTGVCSNPAKPDGSPCTGGACQGGLCMPS
jgi:hypothetical protein